MKDLQRGGTAPVSNCRACPASAVAPGALRRCQQDLSILQATVRRSKAPQEPYRPVSGCVRRATTHLLACCIAATLDCDLLAVIKLKRECSILLSRGPWHPTGRPGQCCFSLQLAAGSEPMAAAFGLPELWRPCCAALPAVSRLGGHWQSIGTCHRNQGFSPSVSIRPGSMQATTSSRAVASPASAAPRCASFKQSVRGVAVAQRKTRSAVNPAGLRQQG